MRRAQLLRDASDVPGRFAYADPPYPGTSARYYAGEDSYAGEVDHGALIASLMAGDYAGWALSTSARSLRAVLPLCPPGARVAVWVKPHAIPSTTKGLHNAWEPVIVVGGRQRPPSVRDWLSAYPARGGGDLPGRKPIAFCAWLFALLGMAPGDELVDLFPGSGIVGRAWSEVSSRTSGDASPTDPADVSRGRLRLLSSPGVNDASPLEPGDTSRAAVGDVSRADRGDVSGSWWMLAIDGCSPGAWRSTCAICGRWCVERLVA